MGIVCTTGDLMALRHIRQKNFGRIRPLFNAKYGQNYDFRSYWYSYSDDSDNGMTPPAGYNVGITTCTNVGILNPYEECFHLQSSSFYTDYEAYYVADNSYNDVVGSDNTLTCGVSLRWSNPYDIQTRDKPWEKYGITWYCSTTLKTQRSVWTGQFGGPSGNAPIYTDWETIGTSSNNYFHQIDPTSLSNYYESNSLFVPKQTEVMGEGQYQSIVVERTRYLGSISVYSISMYRKGNHHHA